MRDGGHGGAAPCLGPVITNVTVRHNPQTVLGNLLDPSRVDANQGLPLHRLADDHLRDQFPEQWLTDVMQLSAQHPDNGLVQEAIAARIQQRQSNLQQANQLLDQLPEILKEPHRFEGVGNMLYAVSQLGDAGLTAKVKDAIKNFADINQTSPTTHCKKQRNTFRICIKSWINYRRQHSHSTHKQ